MYDLRAISVRTSWDGCRSRGCSGESQSGRYWWFACRLAAGIVHSLVLPSVTRTRTNAAVGEWGLARGAWVLSCCPSSVRGAAMLLDVGVKEKCKCAISELKQVTRREANSQTAVEASAGGNLIRHCRRACQHERVLLRMHVNVGLVTFITACLLPGGCLTCTSL